MYGFLKKRHQIVAFVVLAFILGCMFTIAIMPIDRSCKIEQTDKEFNIMKNSKFKSPEVIILILSAPNNYNKRKTVRETWLKLEDNSENINKRFNYKHYFVIGTLFLPTRESKKIEEEQLLHKDILLLPIQDSYKNLIEKIKYSFHWLDTQFNYGLNFKYVLKCDDDSFVNLNKLMLELTHIENNYLKISSTMNDLKTNIISTNYQMGNKKPIDLYWGYFNGNARIKTKGKWKETNWIACDRYVPYALGGGYMLSKGLISYISKNMEDLKSFNSEDISVGFWLSPVANILRIHDIRFDTEWTSRGCKNHHLITHNISPNEMKILYNNLLQTNQMCIHESTKRHDYIYDWNVPPSLCCKTSQEKVIKLEKI
ncbi:beta-1,3-galactosyltransferase 6 [Diorhabda carinulata]|uniref:beta-1,3-galactosyltransferase 6 n=1 Tax=Diorhabda sublineata TaxID=1163346 RepID=UPI0024E0B568|nr:beta-1,3-galactosyltransferase 6 [Diorhabda sublineata]XP_057672014.1 beta-1,3-galactosyltransferase 6 [Diorhabda carinulata]